MSRESRLWNPANLVLALTALVTITSHVSLIWHYAVTDYDTDGIIEQATGRTACERPWIMKGMGNSAHPLGNALLKRWVCHFQSDPVTPTQGWFILMSTAVVVTVALLVAFAYLNGGGAVAATIALAYVSASPIMLTVSNRAEEDWVGSTLFLAVTLCIVGFHRSRLRARSGAWLIAVATSTLVLGMWHTQYLLALALGLVPWGLAAWIWPRALGTTRRRAIALAAAMWPALAAVAALFQSGYAVRVGYHKMYLSVFNPDYWHGIVAWCRDFLGYSARWLTGWAEADGMEERIFTPAPEGAAVVLLGLLALVLLGLLAAMTRDSVLGAITFGCLALPFLYEPHNAERWDATSTIVAVLLASFVYTQPRQPAAEGGAHHVAAASTELDTDETSGPPHDRVRSS